MNICSVVNKFLGYRIVNVYYFKNDLLGSVNACKY